MIGVIGQPPAPVLRDLHTRGERNGARYLAWLNRHRAVAEELQAEFFELGQAAFDLRAAALWDEAQAETWH
jgi:hypothetical protein